VLTGGLFPGPSFGVHGAAWSSRNVFSAASTGRDARPLATLPRPERGGSGSSCLWCRLQLFSRGFAFERWSVCCLSMGNRGWRCGRPRLAADDPGPPAARKGRDQGAAAFPTSLGISCGASVGNRWLHRVRLHADVLGRRLPSCSSLLGRLSSACTSCPRRSHIRTVPDPLFIEGTADQFALRPFLGCRRGIFWKAGRGGHGAKSGERGSVTAGGLCRRRMRPGGKADRQQ